MITKETAAAIWECYREIKAGDELLVELGKDALRLDDCDDDASRLEEIRNRKNFQLGVPSGPASHHRLYKVHPDLALSIIKAHVADKQAELVRLQERARIELDFNQTPV